MAALGSHRVGDYLTSLQTMVLSRDHPLNNSKCFCAVCNYVAVHPFQLTFTKCCLSVIHVQCALEFNILFDQCPTCKRYLLNGKSAPDQPVPSLVQLNLNQHFHYTHPLLYLIEHPPYYQPLALRPALRYPTEITYTHTVRDFSPIR